MKTKQLYNKITNTVLILFLISFGLASCTQSEENSDSPTVRSNISQTLFMYFPWSTNLLSNFEQNIADMESAIKSYSLNDERVIVYLNTSPTEATLFELTYEKGTNVRTTLKSYTNPAFTTAEGITSILNDVQTYSPAQHYSMIIGCHGSGWIPKTQTSQTSRTLLPTQKMHWDYEGVPMTRYFGGLSSAYQTDITTLAEGISDAGIKMEYILFDDCYMSGIEVAHSLKDVTNYLIGSTSEIMAYGMPYERIGQYLLGSIDYKAICDSFYDFYSIYSVMPCGTISVIDCSQLDNMAAVMKEINEQYTFNTNLISSLQRLDGYSPTLFFDYGDYVDKLCQDTALLSRFNAQLELTVPFKRHTDYYYSMSAGMVKINTFSGTTTSDPSTNSLAASKANTSWYSATH